VKKYREPRNRRSRNDRDAGPTGFSGVISFRARSGVTVRETRKEAKSEIEIVNVSGMKSSLI